MFQGQAASAEKGLQQAAKRPNKGLEPDPQNQVIYLRGQNVAITGLPKGGVTNIVACQLYYHHSTAKAQYAL